MLDVIDLGFSLENDAVQRSEITFEVGRGDLGQTRLGGEKCHSHLAAGTLAC